MARQRTTFPFVEGAEAPEPPEQAGSIYYYVATNGNDSGAGTFEDPWLTIQYGLGQATNCEGTNVIIAVSAGSYTNAMSPYYFQTVTTNTTILSVEGAVLRSGFYVKHSNCGIDGFVIDTPWTNAQPNQPGKPRSWVVIETNISNFTLANSTFIQSGGARTNYYILTFAQQTYGTWPGYAATCCTITNCTFTNIVGGVMIVQHGMSNVVTHCRFLQNYRIGACWWLWGSHNRFEYNIVDGFWSTNGAVGWDIQSPQDGHPDFIQTFGLVGYELDSYSNIITGNIVQNADVGVGLTQITMCDNGLGYGATVKDFWFINNVFCNWSSVAGIDIACHWWNNTWYHCGGENSPLALGFYDTNYSTAADAGRGLATNTTVINNAFIMCGASTTANWSNYVSAPDRGWFYLAFIGTNGNAATFGSNLYALNFSASNNYVVDWRTNTWVTKAATPASWHIWTNAWGWNTNADPLVLNTNGATPDMRLLAGSPLLDIGANITNANHYLDRLRMPRVMGAGQDIGAHEVDPHLLMWLDFSQDLTGRVPDVTGNEHHAWQMDDTNWIAAAEGPVYAVQAGEWSVVGQIDGYNMSQYAAITNVYGLTHLTNATVAFWVRWQTNYVGAQPEPERYDTILDFGDLVNYSSFKPDWTNSWAICYGWPDLAVTPAGMIFKRWQPEAYTTTETTAHYWTNQTRLQTNWWHVAITWTGSTSNSVAYENGVPFSTNSIGYGYLQLAGADPQWIALGVNQHSGTPEWADDQYPNAGWFKGRMADVRIYDRCLTEAEIKEITKP